MREKEFLPLVRERLGIERLNAMQEKMLQATSEGGDIMLLSATGSGKTLAFVMSMLKIMKPSSGRVQGVIIVPSRELVIQISGVIRAIAAGLKTTSLYGGHKVEDEVNSLQAGTDIIVATPGRLLDHINRRNSIFFPTCTCQNQSLHNICISVFLHQQIIISNLNLLCAIRPILT